MNTKKHLTDERLNEAYEIMAGIVRDLGDEYLPVFKRLHEEIEKRKAAGNLKDIALQVAQKMRC